MPMLKLSLSTTLLLVAFGPWTPLLAQTCRSEGEIPSSTPTADFIDHDDGTVTHLATGLMWTKCPLGQSGADCATVGTDTYDWQSALETVATSGFAGHNDWRVPNINELRSIVEERCTGPAINASVFPATPLRSFSSSSSYSGNPSPLYPDSHDVWYVHFADGSSTHDTLYGLRHVRLVRSGQ